jgi:histidine racemase
MLRANYVDQVYSNNAEGFIQAQCKQIAAQTNVSIAWVRTSEELTGLLEGGLRELYRSVYADPPYNENFSDEDVREIFQSALDVDGFIFVAKSRLDNKPVGFTVSVPLQAEPAVANIVSGILNPITTAYFAEDGVAHQWRRQGLSSGMKDLLLSANFAVGFDKVVLRTSAYNYKQISAVSKAGGTYIPNITQDVVSPRQDGGVSSDKRAFYLFDGKWEERARNVRLLNRMSIIRPGGNDTAIVWDYVTRSEQGPLSLDIQQLIPSIEQVMFVEDEEWTTKARGQMAGGEFCGNATRSLGYLLLDGRDGGIEFEVSGASRPLYVLSKNGSAKAEIPILNNMDCIIPLGDRGEFVAHLEGISFIVTYDDLPYGQFVSSGRDIAERKERVRETLKALNLADKAASGMLIVSREENGDLSLMPYVYVRDTNTLYFESACGSGSTAIGLVLAKQTGKSIINQKIIQPSGMPLYVTVQRDQNSFLGATVDGPIEVLFDGKINLPARTQTPNCVPGG